jgi:hypothetical protein
LVGRHPAQVGVPSLFVIGRQPISDTLLGLSNAVVGRPVNLLVFQAAPEALNKYIIYPASLIVHADFDALAFLFWFNGSGHFNKRQ